MFNDDIITDAQEMFNTELDEYTEQLAKEHGVDVQRVQLMALIATGAIVQSLANVTDNELIALGKFMSFGVELGVKYATANETKH